MYEKAGFGPLFLFGCAGGLRPGNRIALRIPEDGEAFEPCATFITDTVIRSEVGLRWQDPHWAHGAGQHCFTFRIDHDDRSDPKRLRP